MSLGQIPINWGYGVVGLFNQTMQAVEAPTLFLFPTHALQLDVSIKGEYRYVQTYRMRTILSGFKKNIPLKWIPVPHYFPFSKLPVAALHLEKLCSWKDLQTLNVWQTPTE